MITVSPTLQTTSNGPIEAYYTICIVSTLITLNLITTRMSHCLVHSKFLILLMTLKFPCSYKSHALPVLPCRHIQHPPNEIHAFTVLLGPSHVKHSLHPLPHTLWLSTTHCGVEDLPTPGVRQRHLELTKLPHSLDKTRNRKMLSCPDSRSTLLWVKPRTK